MTHLLLSQQRPCAVLLAQTPPGNGLAFPRKARRFFSSRQLRISSSASASDCTPTRIALSTTSGEPPSCAISSRAKRWIK
mmetsp:Transcript_23374/g.43971  ORF Transcript_23374/g.43971 Transcript_23374/m.43971 type:complete len:80 (+) Transcript_23374:3-242(+)